MSWRNPAIRALLLLLAFGVAGMHTLGHHEGHDGGTVAAAGHGGHAAHAPEPAAVDHTTTANPVLTPPTGDFDPSQMCLAILTAAALLGLMLAASRRGWRVPPGPRRSRSRPRRHATRGPPGAATTNLLLAKVTVLRI